MISSQSLYLRKQNEELLHELEENARHLNRKVEICSELLRGRPRYREEEFTEHGCISPEMSPAKFNRRDRAQQPVKILNTSNPRRSVSASRVSSSSAGRPRSSRRERSICVLSQPISRGSSSDSRWSKFQQDLASQAHMHGYTLSHAQSKCYCTRKEDSDPATSFTGSSRILADPLKTRIPLKLKEKRQLARSPKRRPCNVKWAVPSDNAASDRLSEDIYNIHLPIDDYDREDDHKLSTSVCGSSYELGDVPLRSQCAPMNEHNSDNGSDWFVKMKNFRKSNWDDCHAPDRQDKCGCKCNGVYMVGERLFLEPIHTALNDNGCGCSKPREDVPALSSHDTVVTLPKVCLEVPEKTQKSTEDSKVSNQRAGRISGTYAMNRPCFLTGHKTRTDDDRFRALVLQRPAASFALRYQKGVDPRRL